MLSNSTMATVQGVSCLRPKVDWDWLQPHENKQEKMYKGIFETVVSSLSHSLLKNNHLLAHVNVENLQDEL